MDEFVNHANHNHIFYETICQQFPDTYFDWKLTCLFYVSVHYLKALATLRKKKIGSHHVEINRNIKRGSHNPTMPLSDTAYNNYMILFHYSQTARYDGMGNVDTFNKLREADHRHAIKCFRDFRKYIITQGVKLEEAK
ncbi:MAG TPA: hypothetical protein VF974_07050 [Patescibacteria group bacterium]